MITNWSNLLIISCIIRTLFQLLIKLQLIIAISVREDDNLTDDEDIVYNNYHNTVDCYQY